MLPKATTKANKRSEKCKCFYHDSVPLPKSKELVRSDVRINGSMPNLLPIWWSVSCFALCFRRKWISDSLKCERRRTRALSPPTPWILWRCGTGLTFTMRKKTSLRVFEKMPIAVLYCTLYKTVPISSVYGYVISHRCSLLVAHAPLPPSTPMPSSSPSSPSRSLGPLVSS